MRKFLINVNGNSYEVAVEELTGGSMAAAPAAMPAVAAPAPVAAAPKAVAPEPAPATAPSVNMPAGGTKVEAPMPGTILNVAVNVGDTVKNGDVLVILEAMKMENEIVAPCDGTVSAIAVAKGAAVNPGDILVAIE